VTLSQDDAGTLYKQQCHVSTVTATTYNWRNHVRSSLKHNCHYYHNHHRHHHHHDHHHYHHHC